MRMRYARRALEREAAREGRAAPELDPEQHAAASLVAGTHEVSVVVGPAGAGKTTMLRLATIALEQDGRSAIALSPFSVSAAEVGEATRLRFGTRQGVPRRPRARGAASDASPFAAATRSSSTRRAR